MRALVASFNSDMPENLMSGLGADGFAVDHASFGHERDMHGHFQRSVSAPFSFLFHDHTLDDFDVPNRPIVISPIRHAFEAASWNRYFDSLYRKLSQKLGHGVCLSKYGGSSKSKAFI